MKKLFSLAIVAIMMSFASCYKSSDDLLPIKKADDMNIEAIMQRANNPVITDADSAWAVNFVKNVSAGQNKCEKSAAKAMGNGGGTTHWNESTIWVTANGIYLNWFPVMYFGLGILDVQYYQNGVLKTKIGLKMIVPGVSQYDWQQATINNIPMDQGTSITIRLTTVSPCLNTDQKQESFYLSLPGSQYTGKAVEFGNKTINPSAVSYTL